MKYLSSTLTSDMSAQTCLEGFTVMTCHISPPTQIDEQNTPCVFSMHHKQTKIEINNLSSVYVKPRCDVVTFSEVQLDTLHTTECGVLRKPDGFHILA